MARSAQVLLAAACLLTACDGDFVSLGTSGAPLGEGGAAGVPAVSGVWQVQRDPVLRQEEDLLLASPSFNEQGELFFSAQERWSTPEGNPKPTRVLRALPAEDGGFAAPVELKLGTLAEVDIASPAASWTSAELWLGMNVDGQTDVFRCRLSGGACSTPERVAELCSAHDDAPRPPAVGETLMPLSSKRHGSRYYQIYLAERASAAAPWGEPTQVQLPTVNSPDYQSADGFLAEDGLALYFSSNRAGSSDLYVARRASLAEPFGPPEALADLNTSAEERMPWLHPDGQSLYFVSNRATAELAQYALFVAKKR